MADKDAEDPHPSGPLQEPPMLPLAPPLSRSDATPPEATARWPAWPGLLLGLAAYGLVFAYSFATRVDEAGLPWQLGIALLIAGLTIVMLVPAILLAARHRTRYWGVGLLLATVLGVIIDSGVCVASGSR